MVANQHSLGFLEDASPDDVFRIQFRDGEIYLLRQCVEIDSSVYDEPDGWSGTIVEAETTDPWKRRLFPAGSGLDFRERDVERVFEVSGGRVRFPTP
jgi:hypothetical protein